VTEAEWLACEEPRRMLAFLSERASDRKMRLFAVACCSQIWELMLDPRCRAAVEASAQYADGLISESLLDLLSAAAEEAWEDTIGEPGEECRIAESVAHAASYASSPSLALSVLMEAIQAAAEVVPGGVSIAQITQADLLCDIFGNPFRPAALDPAWRTETVLALARVIYEERAFDRMPILADALQDAGCTDEDVLNHCRGPGPHARGCWVVDLILGKT